MKKSKNPLLIGNWKLNPTTLKDAKKLATQVTKKAGSLRGVDVIVCPPHLYLQGLKSNYRGRKVMFGSQDLYLDGSGAYTGQVSPEQLQDLGILHSILGHSERRLPVADGGAGGTNEVINRKVKTALRYKITPIVCVGEHHRHSDGSHLKFLDKQVVESLSGLSAASLAKVIIAYEPVWAIGSGQAITAHDLHEMKLYIQKVLSKHWTRAAVNKVTIIYGGSVKPNNAADLSREGNMDGFLVGGASLTADDFIAIGQAMQ